MSDQKDGQDPHELNTHSNNDKKDDGIPLKRKSSAKGVIFQSNVAMASYDPHDEGVSGETEGFLTITTLIPLKGHDHQLPGGQDEKRDSGSTDNKQQAPQPQPQIPAETTQVQRASDDPPNQPQKDQNEQIGSEINKKTPEVPTGDQMKPIGQQVPVEGEKVEVQQKLKLSLEEKAEQEGDAEKATKEKAGKTLEMIQGANILEDLPYIDDGQRNPLLQLQSAHMLLASQGIKKNNNAWIDEDDYTAEYMQEKERGRMDKLMKSRGPWLTRIFITVYHVTVVSSFTFSWFDSFKLTMEAAKFQSYHLLGTFNCQEIIEGSTWVDHLINIFHALMACIVLFADTKVNAGLCMSYLLSQVLHTSFKAFQFVMQTRYEPGLVIVQMGTFLVLIILSNIISSVIVIQRFYDLTDRVRSRSKYFATVVNDGGSMNDKIIYQNQSSFLQRKHILREAICSQVFKIIQKIENYRLKGLEPDYVALYKEIHAARLALQDVDNVENDRLLKELKKAHAKRLRQMNANHPEVMRTVNTLGGSMSKLFLVKFQR